MFRRRTLDAVFNMGPVPNGYTYVDRGKLDERVRSALASGTHVAIHGESKHGKSWLRAQTLPDSRTARVQCVPGMDASAVLSQALGRLGVKESVKVVIENATETSSGGGAGLSVKAVKIEGQHSTRAEVRQAVEQQPIGQNIADLGWVADHFREHKRTPVFEDFHNLNAEAQFAMAYIIKAMGEWRVPCVVIGIWTDTHLLKLYNGELDGRIEDVRVQWTFDELRDVVRRGSRALNISLPDSICDQMVRDAYTSVGLLQELAKATLAAAGIRRRSLRTRVVDDATCLTSGRAAVVEQVTSRFEPFIQHFANAAIAGVRGGAYAALLRSVTDRLSERQLLAGVGVSELRNEMLLDDPALAIEDVESALGNLEDAQRAVGIRPAVLAYDAARQRLVLADRRLLLYLRERTRA